MNRVSQSGFSLVELSIVLVIVGTLAASAVIPLSSSVRQARYKQTDGQLESIREAMHGYLASNGKLPCPVEIESDIAVNTDESNVCSRAFGGVPAVAIGVMGERGANGVLLDRWGRPIYYAVSMTDSEASGTRGYPDWLSVGEPSSVGAGNLTADLQLCRSTASKACARRNLVANQIVWVIYSLGERDDNKGLQAENQDDDNVFTISAYSMNAEQPFDDQIIWASRSEVVYWLLKANWLP